MVMCHPQENCSIICSTYPKVALTKKLMIKPLNQYSPQETTSWSVFASFTASVNCRKVLLFVDIVKTVSFTSDFFFLAKHRALYTPTILILVPD